MLKPRVVAVVLVKNGHVVQSLGFSRYLPVGSPEIPLEYLHRWGIDEIVILDIDATREKRDPDFELIERCAQECRVPLSMGGGIRSCETLRKVIQSGADKVILNSVLSSDPDVIAEGAKFAGRQAIVVSIDALKKADGKYATYNHKDQRESEIDLPTAVAQAERLGAGEILINSVDRDGSKKGYDLQLLREVCQTASVPIIACGGVGHSRHLKEGIDTGASAVAAANFFHFSEHSVILAKRELIQMGSDIRLDSYATYPESSFTQGGRLDSYPEEKLTSLRFTYIPEEVI